MFPPRALLAVVALSILTATACGETEKAGALGESCATTDDCGSSLACAESKCTSVCVETRDCASINGGLCVLLTSGERVCRAPSQRECSRNSDCSGVEICGQDQKCRGACMTATDCLSTDTCSDGACVAARTGVDPAPAAKACLNHTDCEADQNCVSAVCTKK